MKRSHAQLGSLVSAIGNGFADRAYGNRGNRGGYAGQGRVGPVRRRQSLCRQKAG